MHVHVQRNSIWKTMFGRTRNNFINARDQYLFFSNSVDKRLVISSAIFLQHNYISEKGKAPLMLSLDLRLEKNIQVQVIEEMQNICSISDDSFIAA